MKKMKDGKKFYYIGAVLLISYALLFNILIQTGKELFNNFILMIVISLILSVFVAYIFLKIERFVKNHLYKKQQKILNQIVYKNLLISFAPMIIVSFFLLVIMIYYSILAWKGIDLSIYFNSKFSLMTIHSSFYILSILVSIILFFIIENRTSKKSYPNIQGIWLKTLVLLILLIIAFRLLLGIILMIIISILPLII